MVKVEGFGSKVSPAVQQEVLARQLDMAKGRLHPFKARQPVLDNVGQVVIAQGQTLSDMEILQMNFLVQGVQGKLP
jgi:simple sugar transport system substrate-binding protein